MAFDFFGRKRRQTEDIERRRRMHEFESERRGREQEDVERKRESEEKLSSFKRNIESKEENAKFIGALKKVIDPEINVDIWTLGLVYGIEEKGKGVGITMTFTTPTCPYGPQILEDVKEKMTEIGFKTADIEVVFNPVWIPTKEVRELLGV